MAKLEVGDKVFVKNECSCSPGWGLEGVVREVLAGYSDPCYMVELGGFVHWFHGTCLSKKRPPALPGEVAQLGLI